MHGMWNYSANSFETKGPFNPWGKSGFLTVTKGGIVRLAFQGPDSSWHDVKQELDGVSNSSELLTHASFCSERESTALLVTHTASQQLRLYRIQFEWQQPKQGDPSPTLAKFTVTHLAIADSGPKSDDAADSMFMPGSTGPHLTHLEILQAPPERDSSSAAKVVILEVSVSQSNQFSAGISSTPTSILSRWEYKAGSTTLDPTFQTLGSKKSSNLKPNLKVGVTPSVCSETLLI
jgi:mediator of RNA polymerase II transcription subunit 16